MPLNITLCPFVPIAMAIGFVAGIGGLILPMLGQVVGYAAWLISAGILGVIHFFSSIPWATASVAISWHTVIAIYILLGILYWRLTPAHAEQHQ